MRLRSSFSVVAVIILFLVPSSLAQDAPAHFRDTFLQHFNYSANRMVSLAEAIPAEKFAWSPGEGVMSIERVYMHIARYNYLYPTENMGMDPPEGIDIETMESITGKEAVIDHLKQSIRYVRHMANELSEADLTENTRLYGRTTQGWGVLFQLVSHMNEHVGQSIAYARMNGVTPPWSR